MTLIMELERIDDRRRDIILNIYRHYEDLLHSNPGSSHNHQAWRGGLADHLADMYRLCNMHYTILVHMLRQRGESLPFTLGQAQVCIFLHDAEKFLWYAPEQDIRRKIFINPLIKNYELKEDFKFRVLRYWKEEFQLEITNDELNAIVYTHGEGDDYKPDKRVMNELAAFVGNLDRTSARILHSSGRDLG